MTTKHTNLALVEGEVYILSEIPFSATPDKNGLYKFNDGSKEHYVAKDEAMYDILYTSKEMDGYKKLDRKWFVKPKVDVEELGIAYIDEKDLHGQNFMDSGVEDIIKTAFQDGYNAKEAEFTREDMENAMNSVVMFYDSHPNLFNIPEYIRGYLDGMQQLYLPKSVTLNENNEVVAVDWSN